MEKYEIIRKWTDDVIAEHGWTTAFCAQQAILVLCGVRGVELHDVTCVTLLPMLED